MSNTLSDTKRVILVDDEPAAIINMRAVLDGFDALDIVAEVSDGEKAIQKIIELRPDIVFLDVEMPGVNGFDVAQETAHLSYQLVFVTAYSEYALDAFGTNAIDYLLKPVRPSVLEKCVRKMLFQEGLALEALDRGAGARENLVLSDGQSTRVLNREHICYIEGIGRYRRVHLDSTGADIHKMQTIISDTTLDDFESQLASNVFIRLHRSYIVNLSKAVSLSIQERRHLLSLADTDVLIPISRANVPAVKRLLSG
ncbi:MAG: LytTR family DNA-binding domain-containing protein [Pseudomonadota bacterium]